MISAQVGDLHHGMIHKVLNGLLIMGVVDLRMEYLPDEPGFPHAAREQHGHGDGGGMTIPSKTL